MTNNDITEFQSRLYRDPELRKTELYRYKLILVLGAGAIGSAFIVALVSLGYCNIIVVDFDRLEESNLSRSAFLYNPNEDIGELKAEVAAKRAQEGMVDGGSAVGINMDAMDIGANFLSQFVMVICCLDSIAARIHISNECRKAGVPMIETGTNNLLAQAQLFDQKGACYKCYAPDTDETAHHSCAVEFRKAVNQGNIPATPIASTMSATLAANMMVDYLCGINDVSNRKMLYDGKNFQLRNIKLVPVPNCSGCENEKPEKLIEFDESSDITVREAKKMMEEKFGGKITIYMPQDFITSSQCPICGNEFNIFKPVHRVYQNERSCNECKEAGIKEWTITNPSANFVSTINEETEERILDMSLYDVGFPRGAVITVSIGGKDWVDCTFIKDIQIVFESGKKFESAK